MFVSGQASKSYMLITVSKYIKDYRWEIGTSKKYAYKQNMHITGMLVSEMRCTDIQTARCPSPMKKASADDYRFVQKEDQGMRKERIERQKGQVSKASTDAIFSGRL